MSECFFFGIWIRVFGRMLRLGVCRVGGGAMGMPPTLVVGNDSRVLKDVISKSVVNG